MFRREIKKASGKPIKSTKWRGLAHREAALHLDGQRIGALPAIRTYERTEIAFSKGRTLAGQVQRAADFKGIVEFSAGFKPRPQISHVIFDFDGTLSLIREGWPEVMTPMFLEFLPPLPGESEPERRQLVYDDIMRLNGKQTIYQMMQLADRIKERGGKPLEPLWYKKEYLRRLNDRIRSRLDEIRNTKASRDRYLVHGARAILEGLCARGLPLYL